MQSLWHTNGDRFTNKLAGAVFVTGAEFLEASMTRFVLRYLKDRLRDQFTFLEYGIMIVFEYEVRFLELSR